MTRRSRERARWSCVVVFAIAMAWVEAACVYYLRVMVDRIDPYQANPLPLRGTLGEVELVREAATLVMLATLGMVAGRTAPARWGYTAVAFGVWDIFYYAFLRMMGDWPRSLLDWDILFLLPLPWWGPVLAPVLIALLMIVGGTIATQPTFRAPACSLTRTLWRLQAIGIGLALYVFMAGSLRELYQGVSVGTTLPTTFNWPMFLLALALMAAPLVRTARQMRSQPDAVSTDAGSLATR